MTKEQLEKMTKEQLIELVQGLNSVADTLMLAARMTKEQLIELVQGLNSVADTLMLAARMAENEVRKRGAINCPRCGCEVVPDLYDYAKGC
jgi:hypothetical protein